MSKTSLLKFQIGPVQEFIAAARSTRDLWSGSYLLSWLVAKGIKAIPNYKDNLIFPNPKGQPLLAEHLDANEDGILIPNLPNLFVARVSADEARQRAQDIEDAIRGEWKQIAQSVWTAAEDKLGVPKDKKDTFDLVVDNHLSISWQITPLEGGDYAKAYRDNGWHLDAVRQTREFHALGGGEVRTGIEKDSLTGKEEALCGGTEFQKAMAEKNGEISSLFKHSDHVGAITLIKRIWHITRLRTLRLRTGSNEFNIRSIPAIAARTSQLDDDEVTQEKTPGGDKYIAAIAFDGDSIGKWVDAKWLGGAEELEEHHRQFSQALSRFALGKAKKIVEGTKEEQRDGKWLGQLIYAGGDDVVALVPADQAIQIASKLRKKFRKATGGITDKEGQSPDASAGIAIAHIHAPLQDLIREAQQAEKRAKNEVGRPAFSVTLMKRSGEISHWGSKWNRKEKDTEGKKSKFGGFHLYREIAKRMKDGRLSDKFPHRVIELLEPYVISGKGLSRQHDAFTDPKTARAVISKEFCFAATRQGSKEVASDLEPLLQGYLDTVEANFTTTPDKTLTQELLTALIGLCTTVAFANRTQFESETSNAAEKQASARA